MNDSLRLCVYCLYWDPHSPTEGRCRRHAPTAILSPDATGSSPAAAWPATLAQDWCGEWHPRDPALIDQEPPLDPQEELRLRNASIAEALLVLPAERRDQLLLAVLTEEERQCPTPPDDFYERVQRYFAEQREQDDQPGSVSH